MAKILLSEADPDVRRLLTLLLERAGHVVAVLIGRDAVPPEADLMLLEPLSPIGLDHARLARAVRPDLPILCVSVVPPEGRFLELGPVHYLPKPFAVDELENTIRRTLALEDLERSRASA